jgi:hypothetical protein
MGIDEPGHHHEITSVHDLRASANRVIQRGKPHDATAFDVYDRGSNAFWRQDAPAAHDE